jgi:hypothetical protein
MKCDDCKYADWKRTSTGRLHPGKSGLCKHMEVHPLDMRLPAAFYWVGGGKPCVCGGFIERGKELRQDCAFKEQDQ